ncbi:MAG TPA: hypothetical protein VE442_07655 [Jatrophihabitans sp.]|nr:hypothetical protein [Jatrophihabitans sp.]
MGRHSAPDEIESVTMTFTPVAPSALRAGRHARSEEDEAATDVFERPVTRQAPPSAEPRRPEKGLADQETTRIPLFKEPLPEAEATPVARVTDAQPAAPAASREPPHQAKAPAAKRRVDKPAVEKPPVEKSPVEKAPVDRSHLSTAADLALLRKHSALRARVIAAVVVPFVLYTVVMYLVTWWDVYLIWVWIPLVTAGILAGSFLDAAHRRINRSGGTT